MIVKKKYINFIFFTSVLIILNQNIPHELTLGVSMRESLNQATDNDKDGLSNIRERTIGTNPDDVDTDKDTYNDGVEVVNGYNPIGSGKN